jgi:hypothetical protein
LNAGWKSGRPGFPMNPIFEESVLEGVDILKTGISKVTSDPRALVARDNDDVRFLPRLF